MSHPPLSLVDLLAHAEAFAEHSLRTEGRVPPSLLAVGPEGQVFFSPQTISDDQSKDDFTMIARLICIAHAATAAVLVLESWMSLAEPDGQIDPREQPSKALNRKEIVLLAGETTDGMQQKILPIIRTDAGGFFGFGEFGSIPATSFKGRFAGILSEKAPLAKARAVARQLLAMKGIKPSPGPILDPRRN